MTETERGGEWGERETHREKERWTDRQTEIQRETETETERQRQREMILFVLLKRCLKGLQVSF